MFSFQNNHPNQNIQDNQIKSKDITIEIESSIATAIKENGVEKKDGAYLVRGIHQDIIKRNLTVGNICYLKDIGIAKKIAQLINSLGGSNTAKVSSIPTPSLSPIEISVSEYSVTY